MVKGCLVVPQEFVQHFRSHSFEISGLLNWSYAMGWDCKMVNEPLDDYDVIMTNVSSTEMEYINIIRQINPDAKIIACFDYGFDIVNQYFLSLQRVKEVLARCDAVFSVNRNQWEWMDMMLPELNVRYMPHPSNVHAMAQYVSKERDGIAYMWHQYDNQIIQGIEILKAVERKLKKPLFKAIIGLKSSFLKGSGIQILASGWPSVPDDYPQIEHRGKPLDPTLPDSIMIVPKGSGWDIACPYVGTEMWYSALSKFAYALDLYTVNSIGRFGIDCAGVGVPLIASRIQDSSKALWPLTSVDPYSPKQVVDMTVKLIKDDVFREKRIAFAKANLEQNYGFARSRERMLRLLESIG